jgi:hypothetical protein
MFILSKKTSYLIGHVNLFCKEGISLIFKLYDTIDDIIKKNIISCSFIVLASEEMQISGWFLILPIRRQLSLIVPYDAQVFGLTGEESNSVWTPPSCVVTTTEAPTTTPIPATTLTK